jgi:hypothetical protein
VFLPIPQQTNRANARKYQKYSNKRAISVLVRQPTRGPVLLRGKAYAVSVIPTIVVLGQMDQAPREIRNRMMAPVITLRALIEAILRRKKKKPR